MKETPFILLVNPWITDFAAFDQWAKPLGLLYLASLLRQGGCQVAFIDCLDRTDPMTMGRSDLLPSDEQAFGCGKYAKLPLPTPAPIQDLPRRYYRYGIHQESLRNKLGSIPRPDLILVTSIMTYWYPGVQDTIQVIRELIPHVPLWLGGIYARLCTDHARTHSGADEVFEKPHSELPDRLKRALGFELCNPGAWKDLSMAPPPALDLLHKVTYLPLLTSLGCPFRCPYCASEKLNPTRQRRCQDSLYQEIVHWHSQGVSDVAFYDDALLLDADDTLFHLLSRLVQEKIKLRFHTPNGLHVRALTADCCKLLHQAGFETIRLGLETSMSEAQRRLGNKVDTDMFQGAIENLRTAGFRSDQIGVYLLCGLPGQSPDEASESIRTAAQAGALPRVCEYSPIPHTQMWPQAVRVSSFDLENEPVTHNNSFFACRRKDFTFADLTRLKTEASLARKKLRKLQGNYPQV